MSRGREAAALAAYSTLTRLITPLYLARLWWRGRAEPLYRHDLAGRLGWGGAASPSTGRPCVWLHAVSLGETRASAPLIAALRAQWPGMRLVLTCGTATGREAGQALLQPGDAQAWMPWDTPGSVRRFVARQRPDVAILMETEVWPVMLAEAERAGLPVVLANARLSEKSLRSGQRLAALLGAAARRITLALAQTGEDAQRLRTMGVAHVEVCGNIKFDLRPDAALLAQGQAWRLAHARPVVMAASTREGEEAMILSAWAEAVKGVTGASRPRLLMVPRHPQRFAEVESLVRSAGLSLSRRSGWGAGGPVADALDADVWLGDSMGEMAAYYAAASVALLGGSFANLGGQNLIEAAACGCPVIMGPSTFNFAQAAEVCDAGGVAWRVANAEAGVALALQVLNDPALASVGRRATALVTAHQGAAQRMAEIAGKMHRLPS